MTQFHSSEPYGTYLPAYYTGTPQKSGTKPPEKNPVYIVIVSSYDRPGGPMTRNGDGSFKITC